MGGEFNNAQKFSKLTIPIAILHGTSDEVIPFAMANQLRAVAVNSPAVRYFPIADARHATAFHAAPEPRNHRHP